MKAIVYDRYGPLDLLHMSDIATPVAGDGEVLVRVRAAGLHIGDCFSVRGEPLFVRLVSGLLKPKYGVPGFDMAGEIDAIGNGVTSVRAGDAVFGTGMGTCAEYAVTDAGKVVARPPNLSFEEAAAIPTSALAALQGLRYAGKVAAGQKVLINGASGGVGIFAVQIARSLGAEVTGVCGTASVDMVRAIGADHVVDYARDDFTRGSTRYDLILDNMENRSLADVRRALTPGGTLLLNSGTGAKGLRMMTRLLKPLILSPFVHQKLRRFISSPKQEDLLALKDLAESGKLKPVIDRTYPLGDTAAALDYIEGGHAHGKVVITV